MNGRTASFAASSLIAVAVAAVLLLNHGTPAPVRADSGAGYIAALDQAVGSATPDATQRSTDLATGATICHMLATGWNQAGVVANLWTWPAYADDPQAEVAAIVHITRESLCGQAA
jgi:hypothetical protein